MTDRAPAPPGMQKVDVPGNFVIYKTKISRGRIIDLPLPSKLTAADVDKIHKMLLTQVDDEGEKAWPNKHK